MRNPHRRAAASRGLLVGLCLFVLFAGCAVWRQGLYIQSMAPYRPYLSNTLIPGERSAGMVKTLALGFDELVSTLLYVRTIQDFGGQFRDPFAKEALANAFFAMVELDPHFTDAYDFGGLVIADEAGDVSDWAQRVGENTEGFQTLDSMEEAHARARGMLETGMRLFEIGIERDPDHYRHPYNATYTAIMGFRNPELGIPYAEVATTRPDCPEWVDGTIAYLQGRSGQYQVALARWFSQLRAAISADNPLGQGIAQRKIAEDGVNPWNMEVLTQALGLWSAFHDGALPASLDRIAQDGFLQYHPGEIFDAIDLWREAHGGTTAMPPDFNALVAEGFFPPDPSNPPGPLTFFDFRRYLFATDELLQSAEPYVEIPESQFGLETHMTVHGRIPECPIALWCIYSEDETLVERQGRLGQPYHYTIDRRRRQVVDSNRLFEDTVRDLYRASLLIQQYQDTTGEPPVALADLYSPIGEEEPVERATGEGYLYDPLTGVVRSSHFDMVETTIDPGDVRTTLEMGEPRSLLE